MPNSIFGLMLKLLRQYLTTEMILLKRGKVRVETKSKLTRGQMLKLLRQYLIAQMILLKRAKVRVETKSELMRGQMSIDSRPVPKAGANAWVAFQVDEGKFFSSFVENFQQLFKTAEFS